MSLETELYNELYKHREDLRNTVKYSNGQPAPICSDESLRVMAQRMPTKLEDFKAIEGIGDRFVEQYGSGFLAITKKYAVTAAKGSSIDRNLAQTLRELQKKLVNISKANRLLFQPKTGRKTAFDPTVLHGNDVLGLLWGNKRVLTVCDASKSKEEEKTFKRVNEIVREVNRDQREKGAYDLYIAYPFVEGKLISDDDFPLRAPLALFPITMEKEGTAIKVRMDDSRDAIYNNTFLLAAMKLAGKNRPLPDNVIETYEEKTFINDLKDFYECQGITLNFPTKKALTNFVEYKAAEFPDYAPGEMHVVYNALIGKYPSYSNFIQRDFDTLLSSKEINSTLADLIRNLNLEDFYTDTVPLSDSDIKSKGMETSEKDLYYINSLNSAQENILTAVNKQDSIVVQGPPGTGKSQVITGLISAAVASGKTVLMVSEKKTALDVVYSRMGTLSKYCMQIDDTADKENFYRQMATMISIQPTANTVDLTDVSNRIDMDIGKLASIANDLYDPGEFGLPACSLYAMDKWLDLNDKIQYEKFKRYKTRVPASVTDAKYGDLRELHTKFGNESLVNNIREYSTIREKNPLIELMKADLSYYELSEMKADLERLDAEVRDLNSKGFLSKLFSKGKVTRDATDLVNKYFSKYDNKTINTVMSDPAGFMESTDDYEIFCQRASAYRGLSPVEKDYGNSLLMLCNDMKADSRTTNDEIYRFVLNDHLQRFDGTHKNILQELHDFDTIVADIDRNINQKRVLTKKLLDSVLSNDLKYITASKRRGEIARIVDNKRKWSLNKFINHFGFELFKGIRIWLLTPEVVSDIIPMEMGLFDLLIFDEASQMYVEKGVPSIYRAKKVVVAGDHKQLRPSSLGTGRISYDDDEDDEELAIVNGALEEESLLDLARARYDSIMLNFHYRSRYEELIAFSNYAFYNGKLYVSPNIIQPERPPIEVFKVDGTWVDRHNEAEADKVVEILKNIFATRQERETIGIISFNVSQRDLINDKIDEYAATDPVFAAVLAQEVKRYDNGEDVGLFVKNIESVQGDERDIIIFSVGYAKNEEGRFMQRFGWLNMQGGENRLNVAISRAKKKIYIVNSFEPEELQVDSLKCDGPKILQKYLKYARAISDGNIELAHHILQGFIPPQELAEEDEYIDESPVMDKVYTALVRKGYTVEQNIGIGGYTIDLAVKQDNKYILGIECDSNIYARSTNTRERDYHRQKYLESRGWHIHRVWTPGMYKDSEGEIAKIVRAIEHAEEDA